MTDHPITPPPELVQHWIDQSIHAINRYRSIATLAAQWGADTELEACCDVLEGWGSCIIPDLRATRRPKPPSLKKQALKEMDKLDEQWEVLPIELDSLDTIRKALEALPDD
jgi:hypothetical protein